MPVSIASLFAMLLLIAAQAVLAAPITYRLNPVSDGASKLTGLITTDGRLGAIGSNEILAWSFRSVGATVFDLSSTDPGVSHGCTGTAICFTATGTDLSYVVDPDTWEPIVWFYDATRALSVEFWPVANLRWGGPPTLYWGIGHEWSGREIEDPVVAAVPEPSPLALMLFALVLAVAYGRTSVSNARYLRTSGVLNVQQRLPT